MNSDEEYEDVYYVRLLDDIHNYFPDLLYNPGRFGTVRDVLGYLQEQTQLRFNLFQQGLRRHRRRMPPSYNPPPPPQSPFFQNRRFSPTTMPTTMPTTYINPGLTGQVDFVTETFDLTPMVSGLTMPQSDAGTSYLDTLVRILMSTRAQEPVIVVPTEEQINRSTLLQMASTEEEQHTCTVCQENYTDGQAMRKIHHCGHTFHKNCIDTWFERNVHCPVCRFDIREHAESTQAE
jgi:hypothetical protein